MTTGRLSREAPFHIAGHQGLVGSAIWRHLKGSGFTTLIGLPSSDLDLRERSAVFDFYRAHRPVYVVLAAARVGGILANERFPAEFLSDNLRIQDNVLSAASTFGAERLLFLGSSCIYPKLAPQPIREESLLTGSLEPTNMAYAVAKIAGIVQVQALRRQYGRQFISAMPTNLFGPNDNFDLESSHVLPAMIRKFHEAKMARNASVALWGTGKPRREFLYVDDLAAACLVLLEGYDDAPPINVGTGRDTSIRSLASLIARLVGYDGEVVWETDKPDGTPFKRLDTSRITALGWRPRTSLGDGIRATYEWYLDSLRGTPSRSTE